METYIAFMRLIDAVLEVTTMGPAFSRWCSLTLQHPWEGELVRVIETLLQIVVCI